jgi:hypothetical protein
MTESIHSKNTERIAPPGIPTTAYFQVYTGPVRIGTIYKASGNPTGNRWVCRTAPVRSTASSERSMMPRPNLPPPGALGSRLPG